MKLSALFDGKAHELFPGENFPDTGVFATLVKTGEDDEKLGPWESAGWQVEPRRTQLGKWAEDPQRKIEQAWGALCIRMTSLSHCIGTRIEMYQGNTYTLEGKPHLHGYHFMWKRLIDGGWQGGRL